MCCPCGLIHMLMSRFMVVLIQGSLIYFALRALFWPTPAYVFLLFNNKQNSLLQIIAETTEHNEISATWTSSTTSASLETGAKVRCFLLLATSIFGLICTVLNWFIGLMLYLVPVIGYLVASVLRFNKSHHWLYVAHTAVFVILLVNILLILSSNLSFERIKRLCGWCRCCPDPEDENVVQLRQKLVDTGLSMDEMEAQIGAGLLVPQPPRRLPPPPPPPTYFVQPRPLYYPFYNPPSMFVPMISQNKVQRGGAQGVQNEPSFYYTPLVVYAQPGNV